jgi:hypothetical protein
MTFSEAVKEYQQNPSKGVLNEQAERLIADMTVNENSVNSKKQRQRCAKRNLAL